MLTAKQLSAERNQKKLFEQLNFTLSVGELCHVTGDNGCGKSTLLAILAGLMSPSSGQVVRSDVELFYLGHKTAVNPSLTALENLTLDLMLSLDQSAAMRHLLEFNLSPFAYQRAAELSQGQQQRIALARFAASNAKLYLLDEPFTACDQQAVLLTEQVMLQKLQQGAAIILTSHQALQTALVSVKKLYLPDYAAVTNHA